MPLKLNVGLSRKIGESNFGSRGASVTLEVEVDGSLVAEPGKLHERIRQLFHLVRTSLAEELNGNNGHATNDGGNDNVPQTANGNGPKRAPNQRSDRAATQSQVKAIFAIARSQRLDIAQFLQQRFRVERAEQLTLSEASQVIDELKSNKPRTGGG